VFDEILNYSGFETGEIRALFEVVTSFGLTYRWVGVMAKAEGYMDAALIIESVGAAAPPAP
jgi:hypothetical protein